VHHQPAAHDGEVKPGRVFRWRSLELIQERPIDFLDMDTAFLCGLDRVGDFDQLAGGDFGVGIGAASGQFSFIASRPSLCSD
jgi:hypothetical protein